MSKQSLKFIEKVGEVGGLATLDMGGKVPASQLPNSIMSYLGTWAASTNTPTLADGVGNAGDVYVASDSGTVNFGSGNITFTTGDWVIYSGSVWQKSINSNTVASVNGFTGSVVLDTDDIAEGSNLYYTDGRVDTRIGATSVNALNDVDTTTTAPTSGQALVWNGTNWVPRTTGSGYGDINYITNSDFEIDILGWNLYKDAAASTPVDGTGGSPSAGTSRNTNVSVLNRGVANLLFSKGAALNLQGEGVSFDFTIDYQDAEAGNQQFISFDYKTGFAYETGDMRVFVYDRDAGALVTVINEDSGNIRAASTTLPRTWYGSFFPNTGNRNYRLIFHVAVTETQLFTLYLDRVKVGPEMAIPGAIITEWESYTPTSNWTTNTTVSGLWRRVGSNIQGQVTLSLSGAPNNPGTDLTVSLPPGLSLDTSRMRFTTAATPISRLPSGGITQIAAGTAYDLFAFAANTDTTNVRIGGVQAISTHTGTVYPFDVGPTPTVPFTYAAGSSITLWFEAPILGWTSGALLSTTQTLFQAGQFRTAGTPTATVTGTFSTIVWSTTPSFDTLGGYSTGTGIYTINRTGFYRFTAAAAVNGTFASSNFGAIRVLLNNTTAIQSDIDQVAGSGTGTVYLQTSGVFRFVAGDNIRIQVQSNATSPVLTADATTNYFQVEQVPDFTAFSVFGQTQYLESKSDVLTAWPVAVNVVFDMGSVTLPPGEWELTGQSGMNNNGAVTAGAGTLAITSTAGNSTAGFSFSDNRMITTNTGNSGFNFPMVLPNVRVVLTTTTTYYLKGLYDSATTNLRYLGYKITARRIK